MKPVWIQILVLSRLMSLIEIWNEMKHQHRELSVKFSLKILTYDQYFWEPNFFIIRVLQSYGYVIELVQLKFVLLIQVKRIVLHEPWF